MSEFIAALPMYDWPELREKTDAQWAHLRDKLRALGIHAPERLTRRNADMPAVAGGIRDPAGAAIAPDPARLPADGFDFHTLWRHPNLLLAQTCWGPMEQGLAEHVVVVGQPSYEGIEGGQGTSYSSVILMRPGSSPSSRQGDDGHVTSPADGNAVLPVELLRGRRLAYNGPDSMSGIIALTRDLEALGEGLDIFPERIESGGHRASIIAVAEGRADVCAIDCRSWAMAQIHEARSADVSPVGWTGRRRGLPFIAAKTLPAATIGSLRSLFIHA